MADEEVKKTDESEENLPEGEDGLSEAVQESRAETDEIISTIKKQQENARNRDFKEQKSLVNKDKGMSIWVAILVVAGCLVIMGMIFSRQGSILMDPDEWGPGGKRSYIYVEFESEFEADHAANFDSTTPDTINGYGDKSYAIIEDYIYDTHFKDEDGNVKIIVHKCKKDSLEEADTNEYKQTNIKDVNGVEVSLKGADDLVQSMTWEKDGYYYQVLTADDAKMSEEDMTALLSQIS